MNNQDQSDNRPDVHIVTTLDQARLLADEFKLRLLRAFVKAPTTVKQVATVWNESPTRLYRHIDALLEAGLLRVVREQPKRGTVERTLQAVASRFEADPSLFDAAPDNGGHEAIHDQFRTAAAALTRAMSNEDKPEHGFEPICLRVMLEASPARLRELRKMMLEWIKEASNEPPDDDDTHSASAMLVFHQNRES